MKVSRAFPIDGLTHEQMWQQCGGFYECPKESDGRRLGPLVGYAGTYRTDDGHKFHYVGDAYYNFALVEELHHVLEAFAQPLATKISQTFGEVDWILAAPMGGIALAQRLAALLDCQFLFAEKKVLVAAQGDEREKAKLVFGRHEPKMGTRGLLIEDVINNFSTTAELVALVLTQAARLVGITAALNRSSSQAFELEDNSYSVCPLIHRPMPQYRQDDPAVTADLAADNIVWKPKANWQRLMAAMNNHR